MKIDKGAQLIRKALKFAEEKHEGQVRKGSGSPYIHHPLMVSYIVSSYKKSKKLYLLIVAAILHDVLEDTDATYEEIVREFGPLVAQLVFELTDDKEEIQKIGKLAYQMKKWPGLSNYALFLKLCDRYCNISDEPKATYIEDTIKIMAHLRENKWLTKSQCAIGREIERVCAEFSAI